MLRRKLKSSRVAEIIDAARVGVEPCSRDRCSRSFKDPISNLTNRSDVRVYGVAICHVVRIDLDE
jgi:hypothetical protein